VDVEHEETREDGECWQLQVDERDGGWTLWVSIADSSPVRLEWTGRSYGGRNDSRRVELAATFDSPLPADAFTPTRPAGDGPMGFVGGWRFASLLALALTLVALGGFMFRGARDADARPFHPSPPRSGGPIGLRIARSVASCGTERETVESGVRSIDALDAERRLEPVRGALTLALAGVGRPLLQEVALQANAGGLARAHPGDRRAALRLIGAAVTCIVVVIALPA
jgi:hypothetical protein